MPEIKIKLRLKKFYKHCPWSWLTKISTLSKSAVTIFSIMLRTTRQQVEVKVWVYNSGMTKKTLFYVAQLIITNFPKSLYELKCHK